MKQIWKFPLPKTDLIQTISIPKDAQILTLQLQSNIPCIWVLCNPDSELVDRKILISNTGKNEEEVNFDEFEYINTFQFVNLQLVFHVFIDKQ